MSQRIHMMHAFRQWIDDIKDEVGSRLVFERNCSCPDASKLQAKPPFTAIQPLGGSKVSQFVPVTIFSLTLARALGQ